MGYQYKFDIAGTEYGMSDVENVKLTAPLFDKLSVGNTCSAELDITLWPKGKSVFELYKDQIPEMAKIIPFIKDENDPPFDVTTYEMICGYYGVPTGPYAVDIPDLGKYAVEIAKGYGYSFDRISIKAASNREVAASIEQLDWFGGGYSSPEELTIYPVLDNNYPALFPYACMHETPEEGCLDGYCSENPIAMTEVKSWRQLGVFWIDTRARVGEKLHIIAYDGILKANIVWTPDQTLEFPMTMPRAVEVICDLMDMELDSRTVLNPAYTIDYPANDWTLRDILGFIAAAHAGNWICTHEGKLLLVPLFDSMPKETNYLVTEDGDPITFGGDRILV